MLQCIPSNTEVGCEVDGNAVVEGGEVSGVAVVRGVVVVRGGVVVRGVLGERGGVVAKGSKKDVKEVCKCMTSHDKNIHRSVYSLLLLNVCQLFLIVQK